MGGSRAGTVAGCGAGEPVEIGCDVARYGSDETVIAIRRGGRVEPLLVYSQKDTMETAA